VKGSSKIFGIIETRKYIWLLFNLYLIAFNFAHEYRLYALQTIKQKMYMYIETKIDKIYTNQNGENIFEFL